MIRTLVIVATLGLTWVPAHAADVEEIFEEALFAGKLKVDTFDMDGLDLSQCWGKADTTDELACVLYGEHDERRTWELVIFHPVRGEVARHVLATRAGEEDAKAGRGLAAANGALKKARWRVLAAVLTTQGRFKAREEVVLPSGARLSGEGTEVRVGDARISVALAPPTRSAVWTFYEVAGQVVVLFDRRTAQGDDAQLSRLGEGRPKQPEPVPTTCASCPANWSRVAPFMASLCEERFGDAELAALKAAVAAGELTKDDVALVWNTVGAMTGYVFKQYPTWNVLLRGDDAGQVPAACRSWLAQPRKEAELPKAFRTTRDQVRAYGKTL